MSKQIISVSQPLREYTSYLKSNLKIKGEEGDTEECLSENKEAGEGGVSILFDSGTKAKTPIFTVLEHNLCRKSRL